MGCAWGTKQRIQEKKCPEISLSSFFVGHLLLGMGPALRYGLNIQWDSNFLMRNQFFLCKRLWIRNTVLVGDGSLCPLPLLGAEIPSYLDLCGPCACCHSLWVATCVGPVVSVVGILHPLGLWQSFHVVPWGEGSDGDGPLRTEGSKCPQSLHTAPLWVILVPIYSQPLLSIPPASTYLHF